MTRIWADEHVRVGGSDGALVHLRRAGGRAGAEEASGDHAAAQEKGVQPVVVLHDAGADTLDAPAWGRLAGRVEVVQVLLPGFGDSEPPPPGADVRWITGLVRDLLGRLWSAPGVLAGTSLGGWFALETALAHPAAVAHLVLLDAAGLHTPPGYLFGLFAAGQGQDGQDGLIGPLMARHGAADGGMPAAAPYVAGMTAAALHSWNPYVPNPSLLVRCAGLPVPTTVLWGRDDALIPVTHGRALTAALGGCAELVLLSGGHLLAIDAPEEVASRVEAIALPSAAACPSTSTD